MNTSPALLTAARRFRRRLPGDERFGDPLSTAGLTPVEVVARSVSSFSPDRESVVQEVGLASLQVWQSLSEAAGRGRGDLELALLFTDLVGFSAWALEAGDAATLELLREVGVRVESAVITHDGRIVKRLGDGLMATFLDAGAAVNAAFDAQEALRLSSRATGRRCARACIGGDPGSSAGTIWAWMSTSPLAWPMPPKPIRSWSQSSCLIVSRS
jgi:adenylate cyclase